MKHDFSLYLVTNRHGLTLENFFKIILHSIEGGVRIVQLREKESSVREICEIAKNLLAFLRPLGIPLIINDRVDIVHAIKADGVHLGQLDLKASEARAILGPKAIIGLSVETLEQVKQAEGEDIDYIAASPIFSTQSKLDCAKPWGLDALKHTCTISRHPVVAIGGIKESNVEDVVECGVAGVAMMSAIFNAPCPKTAAASITNKIKGRSKAYV